MKEIKVLHIIDSLWLWWAQTVIKGIFEKQQNDPNIFLYVLRRREINIEIAHNNVFLCNSNSRLSFLPLLEILKIIKQYNINVIHCHLARSQIFWWLLKVLFFPNIKLVFHEHGEIFQSGKIYPFLMNLFRNYVDIYIAVSEATKKKIKEKTNFWEDKIKVLYNFVDWETFKKLDSFDREKEREKYWVWKNDYLVWFAGRLVQRKWWKEFLELAERLIKYNNCFKFLIAWEGPDKEKIIQFIIENRLWWSVQLVWHIKNMTEFYNMLDCFIFPSEWEPLWLTWLEANACLCPVIASDIEWLNEIMYDWKNALLFKKWDINDLLKKTLLIFNNEKLRNNLIKAWNEESKKYLLEIYLIQLKNIYEKICQQDNWNDV